MILLLVALAGQRGSGPGPVLERGLRVYRRNWQVVVSGFFEPLFYLLAMGYGLGGLVGTVPGPGGRLDDEERGRVRDWTAGLVVEAAQK